MDKIKKSDRPLMQQFKRWAKHLLGVNPRYVVSPPSIVWYIKGPNWDHPDVEYAHYRTTIGLYGDELLDEFNRIRSLPDDDACREYQKLLDAAGISGSDGEQT